MNQKSLFLLYTSYKDLLTQGVLIEIDSKNVTFHLQDKIENYLPLKTLFLIESKELDLAFWASIVEENACDYTFNFSSGLQQETIAAIQFQLKEMLKVEARKEDLSASLQ